MSSKIETKNSSSETQLLDELRSTVITRWDEFDNALPIGASFKSEYQSMKSAYDGLIADISPIKTDVELKQNQAVKTKLDTFLKQLSDYLKREDRRKDLDGTLVETNTQIAKLRDGIYIQRTVQAESGKLQQEVATNKPASTPDKKQESLPTTTQVAAVAAVGGTGAVAAIESGGKKAEEVVKGIMKPLEKIKKWSSDIGSAWDAGWELVKKGDISKGIGLFFAVLFGGNLKDALAKYTGKKDEEKPAVVEAQEKPQEDSAKEYNASIEIMKNVNAKSLESYSSSVRGRGDSILISKEFRNLNFTMVGNGFNLNNRQIDKNSPLHTIIDRDVLKPLGYPNNRETYLAVEYAILSIYGYDKNTILGKQMGVEFQKASLSNPNITIRQAVESFSDEINITHQLSTADISQLSEGVGEIIKIDATGKIEGPLAQTITKSFSEKTISAFFFKAGTRIPHVFNEKDFQVDTNFNGKANPEEVKKLIDFRTNFTKSIVNNKKLTFGDSEIANTLQTEMDKLTYLESLKFYALFGGKSDTTMLSAARTTLLYSSLLNILDINSDAQGKYKSALAREVLKSATKQASNIDINVSDFIITVAKNAGEAIWSKAEGAGNEWWGSMKENPISTTLGTAMVVLFLLRFPFFSVRTSVVGMFSKK